MADLVRVVFWLWVVISLGVLAYRFQRRRAERASGGSSSGSGSGTGSRSGSPGASAASVTTSPPVAAPPSTAPMGAPRATSPEPDPRPAPADDPGGRRGLFAPESRGPQVATIAEALAGISLPCGLTPIVDSSSLHLADKRVVFSTAEAPAPEVGARFGDALEALGFDLRSVSDAVAMATRPDATVELRLHPRAGATGTEGRPLFPTLPEDAVVLVCELRRS